MQYSYRYSYHYQFSVRNDSTHTNRGRLCVCHHQKHSGMFCVTDPHLGAVDDVIILVFLCFSLESDRRCPPPRLRQTEAADLKKRSRIISHRNTSECQWIVRESHRIAGQSRQIELLLLLRALVPPAACLWACSECRTAPTTDGSTFASSSITRMEVKKEEPVPPYSAPISIPISWHTHTYTDTETIKWNR